MSKKERIGEVNYNNFGSKMIITNYRNYSDVDIYFPEYDWTAENKTYDHFKKGQIKCPYEPKVYGVGYIGEGKYTSKNSKPYNAWRAMIQRCYYEKHLKLRSSYRGCEICEEWLNFQNFAKWYDENYYSIPNEKTHLDKDILFKNNKIYSPETCIFVPQRINEFFTKNDKRRGDLPLGVSISNNKYVAGCKNKNISDKPIYLGTYNTIEEAFEVYKIFKEDSIKKIVDSYEEIIPDPHYSRLKNAIYNYKVEITD